LFGERNFLLTREAKRCIAYEIDQSRGRSLLVIWRPIYSELIGTLGRFGHEYNIRTYVENNTTQEHSTRNSSLIKSDRVAIALSVRLSDLVPKQLTTATLENALHEAVCASRHATVILSLQHSTTHLLLSSIEHSN
jgi:hypothetical protein